MSTYRVTDQAQNDMEDIWASIARNNESAADRLISTIVAKFPTIASQPAIGQRRDDLLPGLRLFPVGTYVICFRPTDGGIEILRVLSGRRDLDAMF